MRLAFDDGYRCRPQNRNGHTLRARKVNVAGGVIQLDEWLAERLQAHRTGILLVLISVRLHGLTAQPSNL